MRTEHEIYNATQADFRALSEFIRVFWVTVKNPVSIPLDLNTMLALRRDREAIRRQVLAEMKDNA